MNDFLLFGWRKILCHLSDADLLVSLTIIRRYRSNLQHQAMMKNLVLAGVVVTIVSLFIYDAIVNPAVAKIAQSPTFNSLFAG